MRIYSIVHFMKVNLDRAIDELVSDFAHNDNQDADDRRRFIEQFEKLRSLSRLYEEACMAGWETFTWQRAKKEGWLSLHLERVFADEIKDELNK